MSAVQMRLPFFDEKNQLFDEKNQQPKNKKELLLNSILENPTDEQKRALRIGIKEPYYGKSLPLVLLIFATVRSAIAGLGITKGVDKFLEKIPFFILPDIIKVFVGYDASFFQFNVPSHIDGRVQTSSIVYPTGNVLKELTAESAWELQHHIAWRLRNSPVPESPNFRAFRNFNCANPHYNDLFIRLKIEEFYDRFIQSKVSCNKHEKYVANGMSFTRKSFARQIDLLNMVLTYRVKRTLERYLGDFSINMVLSLLFDRLEEVYNSDIVQLIYEEVYESELWKLVIMPKDPMDVHNEVSRICDKKLKFIPVNYLPIWWEFDELLMNIYIKIANLF